MLFARPFLENTYRTARSTINTVSRNEPFEKPVTDAVRAFGFIEMVIFILLVLKRALLKQQKLSRAFDAKSFALFIHKLHLYNRRVLVQVTRNGEERYE